MKCRVTNISNCVIGLVTLEPKEDKSGARLVQTNLRPGKHLDLENKKLITEQMKRLADPAMKQLRITEVQDG